MKILIYGAGAVGCLFGAYLTVAGYDTTLYVRNTDRVRQLRQNGLTLVESISGQQRCIPLQICSRAAECQPDLVLLPVKSYDTEAAAKELAALPGDFTVLSLQNGLHNQERLAAHLDTRRLLRSVIYVGGYLDTPDRLVCTGPGHTAIAPACAERAATAAAAATVLTNAGMSARAVDETELTRLTWEKLIINSVINPLTALHNVNNGRLPEMAELAPQIHLLVAEGVTVARSQDVHLDYQELLDRVLQVCRENGGNRSSMLEDVRHGRRTEIEDINGAIWELAEKNGIYAPGHELIIRQIFAKTGESEE